MINQNLNKTQVHHGMIPSSHLNTATTLNSKLLGYVPFNIAASIKIGRIVIF